MASDNKNFKYLSENWPYYTRSQLCNEVLLRKIEDHMLSRDMPDVYKAKIYECIDNVKKTTNELQHILYKLMVTKSQVEG